MSRKLAVVGAGSAGAAAAYALREKRVDVMVFEKSRGVCGRAATRRRADCVYEYGANYLKDDDERVARLVTEELPSDGLVDVEDPVWTFDGTGEITEGDDPDERKWTYESGITQLAERLLAAADATVHRETRVATLSRERGDWRVIDDAGDDWGTFDAVLLTPPAPQTADLLGGSEWDHEDCRAIRESIAPIPYRTVVSAVLHYPFEIDRPYYALVNADREHDIGWIGREECKPGHVPDGESLLLVQMDPDWSAEHYHDEGATVVDAVAEKTTALLGDERLQSPDWTDFQGWRYALPDEGLDSSVADLARNHDLFFAGDWVAGEARLHAAVRSGLEAGERISTEIQ